MANAYLAKQQLLKAALIKQGFDHGLQWGFDLAVIALNREFGFGEDRIKRFAERMQEVQSEYNDAVAATDESDVKRVLMDRELEAIYGELQYSFEERYPAAKEFNYSRRVSK